MITLGVDCHKQYSQVAALNSQGKNIMEIRLANKKEPIAHFINELGEPCQAVIETGYSWGIMYDMLTDLGVNVKVANALKVKAIASAKIKTDKIDARILGQLLYAGLIPEVHIPSKEVRHQKDILRQRCWLVKLKTMLKNRIHSIIFRNHIELPTVSDLFGVKGKKLMEALKLPEPDNGILQQDLALYDFVNDQVSKTTRWIEESLGENLERKIIESLPGFGIILSALTVLEIDTITRFPCASKLSSYSGLVPSTYASGGKTYHGDLISTCNRWLRYAFIEASWKAVAVSPYFKAIFTRIKKHKGATSAIVAVARRLSEIAYVCLRDKRYYQERPYAYQHASG
jgi:transposase